MLTNSNVQILACVAIIGSTGSITQEIANYSRTYVKKYFILKTYKITETCRGLKNNLHVTKMKIIVNTIL